MAVWSRGAGERRPDRLARPLAVGHGSELALGYAIGDFFWQERRAQSKGPKVLVGPNTVSLKWETNWEH